MAQDSATLAFLLIMALGIVVWIWSLVKVIRMGIIASEQNQMTLEATHKFAVESGEVTIHGTPEDLSKALVGVVQQLGLSMFGSLFKVTERTADRILITKTGPLICNQPMGLYFSEAIFSFTPAQVGSTTVTYQIGYEKLLIMLRKIAFGLVLGIGLPGLVLVGLLIWFLVVQSEDPGIRWQVFQTLQIANVLWPPFMIMGFYSRGRRQSRIYVENLISSVEVIS